MAIGVQCPSPVALAQREPLDVSPLLPSFTEAYILATAGFVGATSQEGQAFEIKACVNC